MAPALNPLFWPDYLIFFLLITAYAAVGVFFRWPTQISSLFRKMCSRKVNNYNLSSFGTTTDSTSSKGENAVEFENADEVDTNFFLANRNLSVLPVLASTMATFFSAVSIMGTNAEVYIYGIQLGLMNLSHAIVFPIVAEIYVPVFYKLHLLSPHQYIERRFSELLRSLSSMAFVLQMLFYVSVALYAPALALSVATSWNLYITILATGAITIFYTSMGGISAVVWTDCIQVLVMVAGYILIIIFGSSYVGGIKNVFDIAFAGGRITSLSFNPNPFERYTFWTLTLGSFGTHLALSTNATQIQRYVSCKSLKTAKSVAYLNFPLSILFALFQILVGLITYAYFYNCDPVSNNEIAVYDSIFPHLVMKIFNNLPVLRGLFISILFAAALSTLSSGINTLAYVAVDDILVPITKWINPNKTFSPKCWSNTGRVVAVVFGFCIICGAFIISVSPPSIFRIVISFLTGFGGPIFAVFTLGIFFPYINNKGAISGFLVSLLFTLWIAIGSMFYASRPQYPGVPTTTDNCSSVQATASEYSPTQTALAFNIYNLSNLYQVAAGFVVAFIVASIVSLATGMNSKNPVSRCLIAWQICALMDKTSCCRWPQTRLEVPDFETHDSPRPSSEMVNESTDKYEYYE